MSPVGSRPPALDPGLLRRLVHDVGKYVARTARNLPRPMPSDLAPPAPPILAMLLRDLYDLPAGGPAAAVYARLLQDVPPDRWPAPLREAAVLLRRIDDLEAALRAAAPEPGAVHEAAEAALQIERLLRRALLEASA